MSAAFAKGKGKVLQIYVSSRAGYKQRSTGTTVPAEARKMERMCQALKDDQEWQLLDRVLAGKLTLRDLYASYSANALRELKARFSDVNLAEHLDGWVEWVLSNNGTEQTAATYRAQVTTLVDGPFPLSELTKRRISQWLTQIPGITTGTRRKYLYALKSFIRYLGEMGILESDPTAGIKAPKKNPSRLEWREQDIDERIVAAAPAEYRALFAFIKATGAEVSAALATMHRDLELEQGLAHIRGSKNERRNRHDALIEDWALPILREHCRTVSAIDYLTQIGSTEKDPANALVWAGISRYQAHAVHQATCAALEIKDYTLRDSRHSWAVRCRKRGGSFEAIAEQLGHKSVWMAVNTYAVFKPSIAERKQGSAPGVPK